MNQSSRHIFYTNVSKLPDICFCHNVKSFNWLNQSSCHIFYTNVSKLPDICFCHNVKSFKWLNQSSCHIFYGDTGVYITQNQFLFKIGHSPLISKLVQHINT